MAAPSFVHIEAADIELDPDSLVGCVPPRSLPFLLASSLHVAATVQDGPLWERVSRQVEQPGGGCEENPLVCFAPFPAISAAVAAAGLWGAKLPH